MTSGTAMPIAFTLDDLLDYTAWQRGRWHTLAWLITLRRWR